MANRIVLFFHAVHKIKQVICLKLFISCSVFMLILLFSGGVVAYAVPIKGWVLGNEIIISTNDGGATWKKESIDRLPFPTLEAMDFVDVNNGWAVGESGKLLIYDNRNKEWDKIEYTPGPGRLYDVDLWDKETGWAVGENGLIVHFTEGGGKWDIKRPTEQFLDAVKFVNEKRGWAAGFNGTILYTEDGGDKWTAQTVNPLVIQNQKYKPSFYDVDFINEKTGWAVGYINVMGSEYATIYHTTDGGTNGWELILFGRTERYQKLYDVAFLDENNGWAVGQVSYHDHSMILNIISV